MSRNFHEAKILGMDLKKIVSPRDINFHLELS